MLCRPRRGWPRRSIQDDVSKFQRFSFSAFQLFSLSPFAVGAKAQTQRLCFLEPLEFLAKSCFEANKQDVVSRALPC